MADFEVFSITSGSSFVEYTTTGIGFPFLFEGDGIYIYSLYNRLVNTRDAFATINEIMPPDKNTITAICQTANNDVWGGEILGQQFTAITLIFGLGPFSKYQRTPEVSTGWRVTGALPAGFRPSAAVGDDTGILPVLVGNSLSTTTVKIERTVDDPPFTFAESDSGLPQSGGNSRITDLDAATG